MNIYFYDHHHIMFSFNYEYILLRSSSHHVNTILALIELSIYTSTIIITSCSYHYCFFTFTEYSEVIVFAILHSTSHGEAVRIRKKKHCSPLALRRLASPKASRSDKSPSFCLHSMYGVLDLCLFFLHSMYEQCARNIIHHFVYYTKCHKHYHRTTYNNVSKI
jgi:hypothetical protein